MQTLGELVRQTPWLQSPSHLTFLHTSFKHNPTIPAAQHRSARGLEWAFGDHAEQYQNRSQVDHSSSRRASGPWPSDATRWRRLRRYGLCTQT